MIRNDHKSQAFTILELLVVITVLAILIAIAIPRIQAMQQSANLVKAKKEIATIMSALESYKTFNSTLSEYPSSTTTLQATYLIKSSPDIISTVFYDPFASTPTTEYNYLCSNNGQYYVVWSVGLPGTNQPTAISDTGVISY